MLVLYKDPAGDNVFTSTAAASVGVWTQNNGNAVGGDSGSAQEQNAELSALRKRVRELENKLAGSGVKVRVVALIFHI